MWSAIRSAVDVGLQGQASRFLSLAQDYKDRSIEQAKAEAAAAGRPRGAGLRRSVCS